MPLKITGLQSLQRDLDNLGKATRALDGPLIEIKYDPDDPASVEAAISDVEAAIDSKVGPYRGSRMVESLVADLKRKYAKDILDRAAAARLHKEEGKVSNPTFDPTIFRRLENAATDLRSSDYQTCSKHLKTLSRLLHSEELEPFTAMLLDGVDLNSWLDECQKTQGGMVGSAKLHWPGDQDDLGLVILLIDSFAETPNQALTFAHTFYYNGSNATANVQNMTRQMIVPFVRDYIDYIKQQMAVPEPTVVAPRTGPAARKVFIVHGHDDGAREAVARYLEKLDFEVIILHEQPSRGRTIIEKIEEHGEVGFAVVLLTPDDLGGPNATSLKTRARQNVILELGYFIARLTRSRVCALKRGDVEVPSDFGGVVYTEFDENGGWKTSLGRELEAAGFSIDWNTAMHA
jgi:predicted nucleotide-binding protein